VRLTDVTTLRVKATEITRSTIPSTGRCGSASSPWTSSASSNSYAKRGCRMVTTAQSQPPPACLRRRSPAEATSSHANSRTADALFSLGWGFTALACQRSRGEGAAEALGFGRDRRRDELCRCDQPGRMSVGVTADADSGCLGWSKARRGAYLSHRASHGANRDHSSARGTVGR
jgi:hypothetical protein